MMYLNQDRNDGNLGVLCVKNDLNAEIAADDVRDFCRGTSEQIDEHPRPFRFQFRREHSLHRF